MFFIFLLKTYNVHVDCGFSLELPQPMEPLSCHSNQFS